MDAPKSLIINSPYECPQQHWADRDEAVRQYPLYFCQYEAIEAGLVKTPRVVVRDDAIPDAKTYKSKREQLDRWVSAINKQGGFGNWCWDVSFDVNDINDMLAKH